MTKCCTTCKQVKLLTLFNKHHRAGTQSKCKQCEAEYRKQNAERIAAYKVEYYKQNAERIAAYKVEYYKQNAERIAARAAEYYKQNAERIATWMAEYYKQNADKITEYRKQNAERIAAQQVKYQKQNPDKMNAKTARRRAQKLKATPPWLSEFQLKQIQQLYAEAARLTKKTGIKHHVDHFYPLKGKNICGLHVPWNLRVIPAIENLKKGNRFSA